MKKNYFLYIGVFLVLFFSLGMGVDADGRTIYADESGGHGDTSCFDIKDRWITPYVEGGDDVMSCLYVADVEDVVESGNITKQSKGCHIIQLRVDKNYVLHYEEIEPHDIGQYSSPNNSIAGMSDFQHTFKLDSSDINVDIIKNANQGECFPGITVFRELKWVLGSSTSSDKVVLNTEISTKGPNKKRANYGLIDQAGYNLVTNEKLTGNIKMDFEKINLGNCVDLFNGNEELINMINIAIDIVFKILIPVLLIVFGTLDFVKVVFAGKEDTMKKAQSTFIKRLVIAVVIFLLPLILKIILSIINGIWGNIDPTFCGIL